MKEELRVAHRHDEALWMLLLLNVIHLTVWQLTKPNPADCLWERGARAGWAEWAQWKYTTQIHYFMLLRPVTNSGNTPGHSLFLPSPPLAWWRSRDKCYCDVKERRSALQSNGDNQNKQVANNEIIRCLQTQNDKQNINNIAIASSETKWNLFIKVYMYSWKVRFGARDKSDFKHQKVYITSPLPSVCATLANDVLPLCFQVSRCLLYCRVSSQGSE